MSELLTLERDDRGVYRLTIRRPDIRNALNDQAFRELAAASDAFDQVIAVNFPEVPDAALPELARIYGATLQKQVPVGRMAGGVNKRLVRQFRMPGFPLVLVSTDVLQEGEDLHTFCARVIHYGISWTPSAMEQRTGRIDRIGGLAQRTLDGSDVVPDMLNRGVSGTIRTPSGGVSGSSLGGVRIGA